MMVVVSYDVSTVDADGRRRLRKVSKACKDWGQRVQNSVFECVLEPAQWVALRARLLELYDAQEDSLRFYFLGSNWRGHVEHHGTKGILDIDGPIIV